MANKVPPKIKIDVSIDKDTDTLRSYSSDYGTYGYVEKAQKIKGSVTIKKVNREECNRDFTAHFYVVGERISDDGDFKVLSYDKHPFSFKESREIEFNGSPIRTQYYEYSSDYYGNKSGEKYKGYLVFIEDGDGQIVAEEASSNTYEKNPEKFRAFRKGTTFDRDLSVISGGARGKKKRKKR